MEQELKDLTQEVVDLKFKVRDLDFHYKRLDQELTEIKTTVHRLEDNFGETKKEMLQIVEKASSNTPKWIMTLIVSVLLVMVLANAGWVISAIAYHH